MEISDVNLEKNASERADEERLRFLFEAYFDRLAYFACSLIKDHDLASDMAQEAFIKYWQVQDQVGQEEVTVKNYLYVTVKNACLNRIRHERVAKEYASRLNDDLRAEEVILQNIITSEVLSALHRAIDSLPANYQIIGRLAYVEGKRNQEIADELAMSINTVKKQKQKIVELLRTRLSPELLAVLVALTF